MKKKSFTLIEVLASIAIISILAAIGVAAYSFAMNSARESATRALLVQIENALKSAQTTTGVIPSTYSSGVQYKKIVATLNTDGTVKEIKLDTDVWPTDVQAAFLKLIDQEALKSHLNSDGELTDAWGGVIYYAYPGAANKTGIDLVAPGPDGKYGKAADGNVKADGKGDYYDGLEKACDDVLNF
ncbi:MAG: prepilin-type N-terminal cleavage/methylation domain-containing protein [Victivallaceae bacterium]|nr:prepilin-type N-terminal cleavage/methylation domain-containing protein [Victivallaceae bacterium]